MAEREDEPIRIRRIYVKKGDDRKTIYAKARRAFTAADLQRCTEMEEGIPAEQLLADLQAIHREEMQKRKQKRTRA